MPGFELVGKKENKALNDIFKKSNGVLFGHAFDKQRKNIFRVRNFEKFVCKKLKVGVLTESGSEKLVPKEDLVLLPLPPPLVTIVEEPRINKKPT